VNRNDSTKPEEKETRKKIEGYYVRGYGPTDQRTSKIERERSAGMSRDKQNDGGEWSDYMADLETLARSAWTDWMTELQDDPEHEANLGHRLGEPAVRVTDDEVVCYQTCDDCGEDYRLTLAITYEMDLDVEPRKEGNIAAHCQVLRLAYHTAEIFKRLREQLEKLDADTGELDGLLYWYGISKESEK